MSLTVQILVIIAVIIFVITVIILISLKKIIKNRIKKIKKRFYNKQILELERFANCFGIQSKGYAQIRGNGILLLTNDFLFFQMLVPKKELIIPLKKIRYVEKTMSHMGKTKGKKLVKIVFTNNNGKKDSAAFLVSNLKRWIKKLDSYN